jgi:hypothetical protein
MTPKIQAIIWYLIVPVRDCPLSEKMHEIPSGVCGADSQGAIGYALQQEVLFV